MKRTLCALGVGLGGNPTWLLHCLSKTWEPWWARSHSFLHIASRELSGMNIVTNTFTFITSQHVEAHKKAQTQASLFIFDFKNCDVYFHWLFLMWHWVHSQSRAKTVGFAHPPPCILSTLFVLILELFFFSQLTGVKWFACPSRGMTRMAGSQRIALPGQKSCQRDHRACHQLFCPWHWFILAQVSFSLGEFHLFSVSRRPPCSPSPVVSCPSLFVHPMSKL